MDRGVSIQHFLRHCASFPAAYSPSGGSGKSPGGTEKPVCAFSDRKSRKEEVPGREDLGSGSVGRRHGDRRHGDPHCYFDPLVRRYPGSDRSHGNGERTDGGDILCRSRYPAAFGCKSLLPGMVCGFLNGAFWALAGSGRRSSPGTLTWDTRCLLSCIMFLRCFRRGTIEICIFLSPRQWAYPSRYGAGVCAGILLGLGAAAALLLRKVMERRLAG